MHQNAALLASLIGSRICHDLISPIGAISNGLELAELTATAPIGPEMSLIQQSCDYAAARIRFFRIAFGTAADATFIPVVEARKTLADHYVGTRISAIWQIDEDLTRDATQLAYLSALCLETALPHGGRLALARQDKVLVADAEATSLRSDLPIWTVLTDRGCPDLPEISPAHVQFALLARICRDRSFFPDLEVGASRMQMRLPLSAPPS